MAFHDAKKSAVQKANEQIKDSRKQSADRAFEPKLRQNRGTGRTAWENPASRETQQISIHERETDAQAEWRRKRQSRVEEEESKDARSASQTAQRSEDPLSPRGNSMSPTSSAMRKVEERLQTESIKGEWSTSQMDFERKKAGVRTDQKKAEVRKNAQDLKTEKQGVTRHDREWTGAGQKKESLTSAQMEWAAKKQAQHEVEWGAGEKWLSGQFAATSSASHEINSAPSAIQHKALNPDKMPALDEEAMGYDINIPKCYRKLKHHTAMPEDKTECEEWEAVRSRPRDKWYAKNQQSQNSDKFPSHVHESGRPAHMIPSRHMGHMMSHPMHPMHPINPYAPHPAAEDEQPRAGSAERSAAAADDAPAMHGMFEDQQEDRWNQGGQWLREAAGNSADPSGAKEESNEPEYLPPPGFMPPPGFHPMHPMHPEPQWRRYLDGPAPVVDDDMWREYMAHNSFARGPMPGLGHDGLPPFGAPFMY